MKKPTIKTNIEIYMEELNKEYDKEVKRCAQKIPQFIQDCMDRARREGARG